MAIRNKFNKTFNHLWGGSTVSRFVSRLTIKQIRALAAACVLGVGGVMAMTFSAAMTNQADQTNQTDPGQQAVVSSDAEARTQINVKYKTGTDDGQLKAAFQSVGANEDDSIDELRIKVLKVPAGIRDQVVERLKSNPRFEFVEADTVIKDAFIKPDDSLYSSQWYWGRTLSDVAWDKTTGKAMTVAVLDGGINFDHPEFAGKTVAGYDFVNNDANPTDDNMTTGHGTAVSSLIGALTNNNLGIAAGCWSCKIMPVKTSDASGSRTGSNEAKGIQWAADQGAKIINISSSGSGTTDQTRKTAIDYAVGRGAIVVVAAGNTGIQEERTPAVFPNVIAVAASTITDNLTSYSTYGQHVDIAAPGDVKAASVTGSGYRDISGTSFSAPLISSVVALLWSTYPNTSAATIRTALLSTTDACCGGKIGGGRVNVARALAYLEGNGTVADKTVPALAVTAPADNAKIGGSSYKVVFNATDNVAVSKVAMRFDNGGLASSLTDFTINTANMVAGSTHTINLTSYDSSGNASPTITRTVTIDQAATTPTPTPTPSPKTGDLNGDNKVSLTDLSILLSNWNKTTATADINKNGKVDLTDLSILLSNWTK